MIQIQKDFHHRDFIKVTPYSLPKLAVNRPHFTPQPAAPPAQQNQHPQASYRTAPEQAAGTEAHTLTRNAGFSGSPHTRSQRQQQA